MKACMPAGPGAALSGFFAAALLVAVPAAAQDRSRASLSVSAQVLPVCSVSTTGTAPFSCTGIASGVPQIRTAIRTRAVRPESGTGGAADGDDRAASDHIRVTTIIF